MAKIVIKRRVSFDFLGDDYKEGYIVFRSVGIDELGSIEKKAEEATEEQDSLKFIKNFLGDKFIEGKFPDVDDGNKLQDLDKNDIGQFDPETIMVIFQVLGGGVAADPKGQSN